MKKIQYLAFVLAMLPVSLFAQSRFTATPVSNRSVLTLETHFKEYRLYSINTTVLRNYARSNNPSSINFELELPGLTIWNVSMRENDILSPDYTMVEATPTGNRISGKPECITYAGTLLNDAGSRVTLTVTNDIIYGLIRSNDKEYFIEPLHYLSKGAAADIFVVYETKDVIVDPSFTCGVIEMHNEAERLQGSTSERAGLTCVRTELAIASDLSMFTRYGSAAAVAVHNIGVMNNVIWDYVNAQFTNNIEFLIVNQNVSTSAATDQQLPAYTGTDSDVILPNFRSWGQAGNFGAGVNYDLAQLWTTRNIDSDGAGADAGIIGLAYVGVVCSNSRYQLLEDFSGVNPTGSGYILRVLTSHELGHNFGANHDAAGSPFIMAPTVQNTSTWSAASITAVDTHVGSRVCLSGCNAAAPVANFIATPGGICTGGSIQFTDHTIGGPTSWSWTFEGGTPATSALRNPSVSFATGGVKNISLTVNNGTGSSSKSGNVVISNSPATACVNSAVGTTPTGIKSFTLNTISRNTGSTATDGNEYLDFSCSDQTILQSNTAYTAEMNVGNAGTNEFNVVQMFIDYNNDGDFVDANETIHSSPSCYFGVYSFSFTTPAVPPVTNQVLRLRVIAKDCVGGVNACYNVTNGQVEDYGVLFLNIVPVKLSRFNGIHTEGKNLLNWESTSEINSSHFELERSFDGNSYSFVSRINTRNTNGQLNRYNYSDPLTDAGLNNKFFYRLKMADNDGRYSYSNIVILHRQASGEITVYPNPVKRGEMLQIDQGTSKITHLEIFNSLGQIMHTENITGIGGNISISTSSSWAPGQYILRMKTINGVINNKIIIH